jgi:hypothetical protein
MTDQASVLIVRDGASPSQVTRQVGGTSDGASVFYPTQSVRVDGASIGASSPLPVTITPLGTVISISSTAPESSRVLKASPAKILSLNLSATDSGWFLLLDAASTPADGAVTPKKAWQFQASNPRTIDLRFDPPLGMSVGAVLVFSSTGPFTKTASAVAMFSGEVI